MDVIGRQVVRPYRDRRWACLQMNVDDDVALTHVDSLTRVANSATSAHGDSVDRDIDMIGLEGGRGLHVTPPLQLSRVHLVLVANPCTVLCGQGLLGVNSSGR